MPATPLVGEQGPRGRKRTPLKHPPVGITVPPFLPRDLWHSQMLLPYHVKTEASTVGFISLLNTNSIICMRFVIGLTPAECCVRSTLSTVLSSHRTHEEPRQMGMWQAPQTSGSGRELPVAAQESQRQSFCTDAETIAPRWGFPVLCGVTPFAFGQVFIAFL